MNHERNSFLENQIFPSTKWREKKLITWWIFGFLFHETLNSDVSTWIFSFFAGRALKTFLKQVNNDNCSNTYRFSDRNGDVLVSVRFLIASQLSIYDSLHARLLYIARLSNIWTSSVFILISFYSVIFRLHSSLDPEGDFQPKQQQQKHWHRASRQILFSVDDFKGD